MRARPRPHATLLGRPAAPTLTPTRAHALSLSPSEPEPDPDLGRDHESELSQVERLLCTLAAAACRETAHPSHTEALLPWLAPEIEAVMEVSS